MDKFERLERFAGFLRKSVLGIWLTVCMLIPGVFLVITIATAELFGALDEDND